MAAPGPPSLTHSRTSNQATHNHTHLEQDVSAGRHVALLKRTHFERHGAGLVACNRGTGKWGDSWGEMRHVAARGRGDKGGAIAGTHARSRERETDRERER